VVTVMLGSVPQGQGHATVARSVAARRLGLPEEQVRVVVDMDTATTPWTVTSGSYSSRFAPLVTSAVVQAADRIAATIKAAGSVLLGVPADELELADGLVRHRTDLACAAQFRHAAGLVQLGPERAALGGVGAAVRGSGVHPARGPGGHPGRPDQLLALLRVLSPRSSRCGSTRTPCRSASTGCPRCTTPARCSTSNYWTARCTARSPKPWAGRCTRSSATRRPGQPTSATFLDYLCPTSAEAGYELRTDHLVSPSPLTPLGAKGCGEGSSMSFPVALANAVADALAPAGVQITSLPLHGEVIHNLVSGDGRYSDHRHSRPSGGVDTWR